MNEYQDLIDLLNSKRFHAEFFEDASSAKKRVIELIADAASVGIGGSQTGVYPLDSPGGWRLIGGTPVDFYDPNRPEPVLCKAGEYIRFVPISSCEYYDIRQQQAKGLYQPKIRVKKEAV